MSKVIIASLAALVVANGRAHLLFNLTHGRRGCLYLFIIGLWGIGGGESVPVCGLSWEFLTFRGECAGLTMLLGCVIMGRLR